jgi:hypothetical protein
MIVHVDRDHMMGPDQRPPGHDFLQWSMELAKFQGQISQHIYGHRPGTRSAKQLLLDTAKLDSLLLRWANEVPIEFRPGADLFCSIEYFHIAAQLSIQYYQALIALHRAALIAPLASFEAEVSEHCANDPARFRLKKGESICVNSARSIARLTIELADRKIHSRILSVGPPLLACVVLAIYLVKTSSRLQAADLELLKACAELTSEQCLNSDMDPRFAEGPVAIYKQVLAHFDGASPKNASKSNTNEKGQNATPTVPGPPQSSPFESRTNVLPYQQTPPRHARESDVRPSSQTPTLDMSAPFPAPFPHANASFDKPFNAMGTVPDGDQVSDPEVPFTGLGVEDLWNWMLDMDSNNLDNDMSWLQSADQYLDVG